MRVEDLFKPEAFEAVREVVAEAERRTSGEIVPLVVERTSEYRGLRMLAAALLALAAGTALLLLPLDPALWLAPIQGVALALGYWVGGRGLILRWLTPQIVRASAVDRAAKLAFLEQGVGETRERTGILIFIALLEHRVEVLADRGIHERVEAGTWDRVVEQILAGIRERRAEEGLVQAIRTCGEILARHFPRAPDDTDELSDRLRRS